MSCTHSVWSETCFDLWEEVNGVHHFNILITIRALYDAHKFATRLGASELAEKYKSTADEIEKKALEQFWDKEGNYLKATVDFKNDGGKVRWLDTGTVLGFLHSGDLNRMIARQSGDNIEWLGSDKSLATVYEIAQSMREEYSINRRYYPSSGRRAALGWAVGRYYEDVYDGDGRRKTRIGNPWYLCTLAQAEFYYRLTHYFADKTIHITDVNKKFYLDIGYFAQGTEDEEIMVGQKYMPGSKEHKDILDAFREKGDAFVRVVRDFARWNGGLWEQFDRENGVEMGASHLT